MNFLAHLILSGDSDEILIGNFIADAVKGRRYESYPEGIIKGILLHRKIDSFTDSHPIFDSSRSRLRANYGKFAGIITDIFYDHFLAVHWTSYHPRPLAEYVANIYDLIERNMVHMPPAVQEFFPYMRSGNWLLNYARIEGVRKTLEGMTERSSFKSEMYLAVNDLVKDYPLYENEFLRFFPELMRFSRESLSKL